MTTQQLLDEIVIPRPNGSEGMTQVASFVEATLQRQGAEVTHHTFIATPYGFQLLWGTILLLVLAWAIALHFRRYRLAWIPLLLAPVLMVVEMEFLWSPVSGLLPANEDNIIGVFAGRDNGPTLIFTAHYDTATNFGDHFEWYRWGVSLGPALLVAAVLTLAGARRGRLRWTVGLAGTGLVLIPFAAMAWFFVAGPWLRTPSPGALDNGGAVAVLLQLGDRLATRRNPAATVQLVFLAAEEERALGSWHYAATLDPHTSVAVINLETVGSAGPLAYAPEEGFQLFRYPAAPSLVALLNRVAQARGEHLAEQALPAGVITDGRSFLAHGIPAITLLSMFADGFPRDLHSASDDRSRLSVSALDALVDFLMSVVDQVDRMPHMLGHPQLHSPAPSSERHQQPR